MTLDGAHVDLSQPHLQAEGGARQLDGTGAVG